MDATTAEYLRIETDEYFTLTCMGCGDTVYDDGRYECRCHEPADYYFNPFRYKDSSNG